VAALSIILLPHLLSLLTFYLESLKSVLKRIDKSVSVDAIGNGLIYFLIVLVYVVVCMHIVRDAFKMFSWVKRYFHK
jgi:hypothetical protein